MIIWVVLAPDQSIQMQPGSTFPLVQFETLFAFGFNRGNPKDPERTNFFDVEEYMQWFYKKKTDLRVGQKEVGDLPDYDGNCNYLLQILDLHTYNIEGTIPDQDGHPNRKHVKLFTMVWKTELPCEPLKEPDVVRLVKDGTAYIDAIFESPLFLTSWPENPLKSLAFLVTYEQFRKLESDSAWLNEELDYYAFTGSKVFIGRTDAEKKMLNAIIKRTEEQHYLMWNNCLQIVVLVKPADKASDIYPFLGIGTGGTEPKNPKFLDFKAFNNYQEGYAYFMGLR